MLESVHQWVLQKGFKFSVPMCIGVVFSRLKIPQLDLTLDGQPIPFKNSAKYLVVHFHKRLNFKSHINSLLARCEKTQRPVPRVAKVEGGR